MLLNSMQGTARSQHEEESLLLQRKVRVGQKAYVTADAFGKKKFWGWVVRVGQQLGPKNVRTDEPTEKVDTKILETLVELDPGSQLPDGLRVDAFIVPSGGEVAQRQPGRF